VTKFSANLGFLFTELSLPDAIESAARHGFDAVECHFPYSTPASDTQAALDKTGLRMLGLNTIKGDESNGDNGLCAIPERIEEARISIDQAIDYAALINAPNIHVMAGNASGSAADKTYLDNLRYATSKAAKHGITILIEPLNPYDAPGYYLNTTNQARKIIAATGADNLKLMFDCYHVQIIEGDVCRRLKSLLPIIGHIQIASVPERSEPDHGELDYRYVLGVVNELGFKAPIGAEYKPASTTEDGLGWMKKFNKWNMQLTTTR